MSLTSQLHTGVLGAWCAERLPGAGALVAQVQTAAATTRPVRPLLRQVEREHWATVGGAFGQRLAFLIQHAPPYYALLGAARAGLVDQAWPDRVATAFPTHAELPEPQRHRACQSRPSPTGWLDLAEDHAQPSDSALRHEEQVATDLITRLVAYLAAHTPPGTIAAAGAETGLARVCWVLAGWENAYRTGGQLPPDLAALCDHPNGFTVDSLRSLAQRAVVSELIALSAKVTTSDALDRLHALADHPTSNAALGYAGPVFIPHWADGDLLLGTGGATTLLDVKTVMHVRDGQRVARWLYQLLGYAWLDPADRYHIRHVGLYLARHGILLTWPFDQFTGVLLGNTHPRTATIRHREFLNLATHVMATEGADPTWLPAEFADR